MDIRREEGVAVIVAFMASSLLLAIGTAIVLTTTAETSIAASFRNGYETLYAAEAALELSVADLQGLADWNQVLDGSTPSVFVDGSPIGARTLADGSTIDLGQIVNLANCLKLTACSVDEMNAVTAERPWGSNNPHWRLYAYGSLSSLLATGGDESSTYVLVLVGDDPTENDGDPTHDGLSVAGEPNLGLGVLVLRAEAFGRRGSHRVLEATLARTQTGGPALPPPGSSGARVLAWRHAR